MKKRQAQSGDRGIIVTALGYAIKARPGPVSQKKGHIQDFYEYSIVMVRKEFYLTEIKTNVITTTYTIKIIGDSRMLAMCLTSLLS